MSSRVIFRIPSPGRQLQNFNLQPITDDIQLPCDAEAFVVTLRPQLPAGATQIALFSYEISIVEDGMETVVDAGQLSPPNDVAHIAIVGQTGVLRIKGAIADVATAAIVRPINVLLTVRACTAQEAGLFPVRRWTGPLVIAQTTPPEPPIDRRTVQQIGLYIFPKSRNLYPARRFNQLELYWGLWTMPTGATFVDISLVPFRAFIYDPVALTYELGAIALDQVRYEVYEQVWDQTDTINNLITLKRARFRKTAADGTFTPSASENVYGRGTRLSFPLLDDYPGFLVQHDGTNATGVMTLVGSLGWA